MSEWMDGDGWMTGWMHLWVGGWMGGCASGWGDGWMDERVDAWVGGWMDVWPNSQTTLQSSNNNILAVSGCMFHLPVHAILLLNISPTFAYFQKKKKNSD